LHHSFLVAIVGAGLLDVIVACIVNWVEPSQLVVEDTSK